MSDRERVINELQKQVEELEERIAIMAEQMETIPDKEGMTPDIDGGGVVWYFCCGVCRHSIRQEWKYCPECGRLITWVKGEKE